jgi:hypothetical protein
MDDRRFVSVRRDSERIQTCFFEAMEERVRVHDTIHEKVHDAWAMKVRSCEKLRSRGMVMIVAEAPSGISDPGCFERRAEVSSGAGRETLRKLRRNREFGS